MTMQEAIQKAMQNGYANWTPNGVEPMPSNYPKTEKEVLLDTEFWKALGRAMGWAERSMFITNSWDKYMILFMEYIVDGKTIEEYFANLN